MAGTWPTFLVSRSLLLALLEQLPPLCRRQPAYTFAVAVVPSLTMYQSRPGVDPCQLMPLLHRQDASQCVAIITLALGVSHVHERRLIHAHALIAMRKYGHHDDAPGGSRVRERCS